MHFTSLLGLIVFYCFAFPFFLLAAPSFFCGIAYTKLTGNNKYEIRYCSIENGMAFGMAFYFCLYVAYQIAF